MKKKIVVLLFISCTIGLLFTLKQKLSQLETFYEEISMKDLKQIMDKKEDTVVYFYKTDCISCKKLARKLQDNNLKKYNVKGIDLSEPENVDENFLTKYDIVTVPTFFKIVDGKMTEKTDGIKELKDFKQFMESDE
ncbi:hypothetical protein DOK67_0001864 [Enterococcus sp. DIV0212c]|uniref:thioredoxin family protein n=1 Tax=Enterococcus sp. DIV0212c TaxID=2230867 RepID=UPI001AC90AEA|nr:thioredoxin family protein [Enterococcus sp. DIV0212c]